MSKIQSSKKSSKICHGIITDYKALLCTPQEGGHKVTEGSPYFRYIGAWGPHVYCKIRAGGSHSRVGPIYCDTGAPSGPFLVSRTGDVG